VKPLEWLLIIAGGGAVLIALTQNTDSSADSPQPVDFSPVNNLAGADVNSSASQGANGLAPSLLEAWAKAIQSVEGGGPLDRNTRNNNPGNLKFAGQAGATGADAQGFAIFSSFADGWAALLRQLQKYVTDFPQYNLTQLTAHYLGQSDALTPKVTAQGNPFAYSQKVASALGVSVDSTLQSIFGG
jgi:hypothetical protein